MSWQEFESSLRRTVEIFNRSADQVRVLLDELAQTPMPEQLAVWENEGGAL